MVLGAIIAGIATPTEAAVLGVAGSILSGFYYKTISWEVIKTAFDRTLKLTGMIMWILIGAYCFTAAYQGMGAASPD